ncbi:MAG: tripartite tricarboxylate transporter substrate binding protein [Reyranellaceae bacterium]
MKRPRCLMVVAYALLLAVTTVAGVADMRRAAAQPWPSRPVTLVVPYSAGGSQDAVARLVSPGLAAALGQQVVVDNVGGAGGSLGVIKVAKAAPDGYQFLLGNVGTHAQSQSLYDRPPYDAVADFVPVALLVDQAMLLAVRKELPASNLAEFTAYARANGSKMQYGSAGIGSPTHLACALLNAALGVETTHVPYRGGGPAMQDLMAGRIDYFCFNTASIKPQVDAGTVKALAILSAARVSSMPSVATAQEQGLKDFEVANWMAFFLPRNTPPPIVARLHQATTTALADRPLQEKLRVLGAEPVAAERMPPDQLPTFIAAEIAKWRTIIKQAGIRLE